MPSRAAPRLYAFKILHFLVVELAGERAIRKHRAEHALDDAEFLNERPAGHDDGLRGDFLAVQQGHAGAGAFLDTHDGHSSNTSTFSGKVVYSPRSTSAGFTSSVPGCTEPFIVPGAYALGEFLALLNLIVHLHLIKLFGFRLNELETLGFGTAQILAAGIPVHLDARVFDGLTHPADNERIELVVHLIIFKGGVALIAEIVRNVDDETRVLAAVAVADFDGFEDGYPGFRLGSASLLAQP